MNTTLTTPRRHDHPPSPATTPTVRRVGVLDRLALRVGLALITWGRRPTRARKVQPTREQIILLHVAQRARAERERSAERSARLTVHRR